MMLRIVPVVMLLTVVPAMPASSAPVAIVATGLNQPGIPADGCVRQTSVGFSGTAVTDGGALAPISFTGRSTTCTSLLADEGDGTFSGVYAGFATYVRTNAEIRFTGWDFTLTCTYQTSVAPAHEFALECAPGTPPPPPPVAPNIRITASGTASPGYPTTGCVSNQNVTFTADLSFDDGETAGFWFSGSSHGCGTFQQDSGSGWTSGAVSGGLSYSRSYLQLELSGAVSINGTGYNLDADCLVEPTSLNPMSTYRFTCAGNAR